ncbi:MAG TPA: hypothetical protein PK447_05920 [Ignavibacteria bacterium]|nr:hypothetical protein [Ignavibacteria bacterium]
MDRIKTFFRLSKEYEKLHPGDSVAHTLSYTYGMDRAIKIMKKAKGRKILVKYMLPIRDLMYFKYEDEPEFHP